jgi:hypothetical protein
MNSTLRQWHILCWNIRDTNSEDKHNALRAHIDSSGCAIICLQETNRRALITLKFENFVQKVLINSFFPSDGNSGGLVIICNSTIFRGELVESISWAITIKFFSTQSTTC